MIQNAFYFTLKVLVILKMFKFLSWPFGHVGKRLDQKGKIIFKIYDITACLTNNCNTHIDQYLRKSRQSGNETNTNHTRNSLEKLFSDPFLKNEN